MLGGFSATANPMAAPDVTILLKEWTKGKRDALDRLMPLVYDELRSLASSYLRNERPGITLQSTALVNEAYLRMVNQRDVQWQNRAHFFGIAAQMLRRILVDHGRSRKAAKRGSGSVVLPLDESLAISQKKDWDVVAVDEALDGLAKLDPQQAKIVELRFFGGLTIEETAEAMGISASSVNREWLTAKAWLGREMERKAPESPEPDR
jgi:RNA polymerase sigma factor (TIGR02999 family)